MAETAPSRALVPNIKQCIDLGSKLAARLLNWKGSGDVRTASLDVLVELIPLLAVLRWAVKQAEAPAGVSTEFPETLVPVVTGLYVQLELLESILVESLEISSTESRRKSLMRIASTLYDYLHTLQDHQESSKGRLASIKPSGPMSTSNPYFLFPFDRNRNFVGRRDILQKMDESFKNHQRVILEGVGGVGKTQIAIEYSYKWHHQNPQGHIFWINASNQSRLKQAYYDIAKNLNLPGYRSLGANIDKIVFDWLYDKENGQWLLILDNIDDMKTLHNLIPEQSLESGGLSMSFEKFLPRRPDGSMIITSRDMNASELFGAKAIMVLPMYTHEALDLLCSVVSLESGPNDIESKSLVDALEHLPLAISQASAFIRQNHISAAKYAKTFRDRHSAFRVHLGELEIPKPISKTWNISFDYIRRKQPRAAELLSLMSVLDPHGIPEELLRKEGEDKADFTSAVGVLTAFSLIICDKGGNNYRMHEFLPVLVQTALELESSMARWQDEAQELLAERFPSGEYETWNACEVLYPHAQAVLEYKSQRSSASLSLAELLSKLACYDLTHGRYDLSFRRYVSVRDICGAELGKGHPDTLRSMSSLANVLCLQGKYEESETMQRQALESQETVLGKEHPNTLTSMSRLANVLCLQGEHRESEKMHRQALYLGEQVLGKEHPDTLRIMSNLAFLLRLQGEYEESAAMQRQVTELQEKILGSEHPDTLFGMRSLANVLYAQGNYSDASMYYQQAYLGFFKLHGGGDPSSLACLEHYTEMLDAVLLSTTANLTPEMTSNLWDLHQNHGRLADAEALFQRALKWHETVVGGEHNCTLEILRSLGLIYHRQGNTQDAEKMWKRALAGYEKSLEFDHAKILAVVKDLGMLYDGMGIVEEAQNMWMRSLSGLQIADEDNMPVNVLSYDDTESITDSSSDGHVENEALSSFAKSYNADAERPKELSKVFDFDESHSTPGIDPLLEETLWPQKNYKDLIEVRKIIIERSPAMSKELPNISDSFVSTYSNPHHFQLSQHLSPFVPGHVFLDMPVMTTENLELLKQNFGDDPHDCVRSLQTSGKTISAAFANSKRLEARGFCKDAISILVADETRQGVALLIPIPISRIEALQQKYERIFGLLSWTFSDDNVIPGLCRELKEACVEFLLHSFLIRSADHWPIRTVWEVAAKVLDMAVVSYSFAHTAQLTHPAIEIPILVEAPHEILLGFRLEQLQCLSGLVRGQKVWVFRCSRKLGSEESAILRPLYLSTSIAELGDLWGPLWGVESQEDPSTLQRFEIGGGSIISWEHRSSHHPQLLENERFSHWLSEDDDAVSVVVGSAGSSYEGGPDLTPFSLADKLLIGATPPRLRIEPCSCPREAIVTKLLDSGCLSPFQTRRGHHYIDSTSTGGSVGKYVTLTASKTKKWEPMKTWKLSIMEQWVKNADLRGQLVLILERYVGVVVSLCTFNSKRVRLREMLRTDSMLRVLGDFRWENDDCRDLFHAALYTPNGNAMTRLWRDNPNFQDDIGNAILACLRLLSSTGYDTAHDELVVFWAPSPKSTCCPNESVGEESLAHRVVLKGAEHQWVRLLRDSETSCTMAVAIEDSIANRGKGGRSCRRRESDRPTVLETALRINGNINPSHCLRERVIENPSAELDRWHEHDMKWEKYWDVTRLTKGSTFYLGYQGRLKVAGLISETGLLLTWDKELLERIREALELNSGGPRSICHSEFSGETFGMLLRPIPAHIMSQD